jgi:predicted SnoaL-like aldol condensation-catalyzing enzyme
VLNGTRPAWGYSRYEQKNMKAEITRQLVSSFIDKIWNRHDFNSLGLFLAESFTDHSLPPALPSDATGTLTWIKGLGASFEHRTEIVKQVAEGNHSFVEVKLHLRHIGRWREIDATGMVLSVTGYRRFQVQDNKIIAHWALIDGEGLKNKLLSASAR